MAISHRSPRSLRGLQEAWRAELSRRGARGRALRTARRRRFRTRRGGRSDRPSSRGRWARPMAAWAATSPGRRCCATSSAFSSGFIFTTALPPAVAAAARASIRHLKESDVERQQQRRQVARLRARLDEHGIPHLPNPSHIIPVMIKDPVKCRMLGYPDGRSRGLCAADQLSDRAQGHRAAALHALAAAHRRGYRPSGHGAQRALATLGRGLRQATGRGRAQRAAQRAARRRRAGGPGTLPPAASPAI
jgi:hypothetical protein